MNANRIVIPVNETCEEGVDGEIRTININVLPAEQSDYRKRAMWFLATGIFAIVACKVAERACLLAREKRERHEHWNRMEAKLDQAIEDTMDASDPIAKYK